MNPEGCLLQIKAVICIPQPTMELIGNNARQFEIGAALHSPITVQPFLHQSLVEKFRNQ
jgi:hypothetical protein